MRDYLKEAQDRHFKEFDAYFDQLKANDITTDTEPIDESSLNLEEFKAHQAREHELKHHLKPNSLTFEDVIHDKDILTRKEIGMIKNGYSSRELKAIRASEWKAYQIELAAKTR